MDMYTKKQYIAPQLMVVEFKAERGYAGSMLESIMFWESEDARQVEDYQQHDVWTDEGGFWN